MYLKCFFATHGGVKVKTIFSPVSVCNVHASSGYLAGLRARFVQGFFFSNSRFLTFNPGTRHLWASLDTGYMLRRTLLAIAAPDYDAKLHAGIDLSVTTGLPLPKLFHLFHRVLEAHTLMCQVFLFILASTLVTPGALFWSGSLPHPHLLLALSIGSVVKTLVLLPNIFTIYYYYKYHKWVGFERWILQDTRLLKSSLGPNHGRSYFSLSYVDKSHTSLRVQPLVCFFLIQGKRPHLYSPLNFVRFTIEFACGSIAAAACFYLVPCLIAQFMQLFTDHLEYRVAEKPICVEWDEGSDEGYEGSLGFDTEGEWV